MAKRNITMKCAYTKEELSPGYSEVLAEIIFDSDLKDCTYEQVERVIEMLKEHWKEVLDIH